MSKSVAQYSELAQDPEKPSQSNEATEETTRLREKRIRKRKLLFLFFGSSLSLFVLLATGSAIHRGLLGRSCQNEQGVVEIDSELVLQRNLRKRAVPSPTFSTTTYPGGTATSTFVCTTREIINPGGIVIGTLTGYVRSPTSSPSLPSSTASMNITSSSSPTPTSTASSIDTTAVKPRTFRSKIRPTLTFSPSIPTKTPFITARAYPQDQWNEVDSHLNHKRGMDFEEAAPPSAPTPTPEYSYSILSNGATKTFVRTTRPIVNPGGATIGTLSNAFVPLPTPPLPHNPKHTLKEEQEKVVEETQVGRASGELRKREEEARLQ